MKIPIASIKPSHIGKVVNLAGWAVGPKRIRSNLAFLPLRDSSGTIQLKCEEQGPLMTSMLSLNPESVISVTGVVQHRPSSAVLGSNDLEVQVNSLEILNKADLLPYSTQTRTAIPSEETLLKYRFVELRKPKFQDILRKRSAVSQIVRNELHNNDFVEIETPLLFKSTPEGAREFLVPTRQPGYFFALPQSPQQFKQVLMSGGFEKYFQFARCFRDESVGSDRQQEFTQIDLEMAFATPSDIMNIVESFILRIWKDILGVSIPPAFPIMTYNEAMSRYGSDKPDTRFEMEIQNLSQNLLTKRDVDVFAIPKGVECFSNAELEKIRQILLNESFPLYGGKICSEDLCFIRLNEGNINSWWKRFDNISLDLLTAFNTNNSIGDVIVLNRRRRGYFGGHTVLGRARTLFAKELVKKKLLVLEGWKFLWVNDFPLFTRNSMDLIESTHHPFTAPTPEDMPLLFCSPDSVRALHYDLVLNGNEIGGGSIRIHQADIQSRVLSEILKITPESIDSQFGHLLNALRFGCPPHGGIALGLDRLIALICQAVSIRDVIAFPKLSGGDLFVGSPSKLNAKKLEEYNIQVKD